LILIYKLWLHRFSRDLTSVSLSHSSTKWYIRIHNSVILHDWIIVYEMSTFSGARSRRNYETDSISQGSSWNNSGKCGRYFILHLKNIWNYLFVIVRKFSLNFALWFSGIPIKSTLDNTTTVQYAGLISQLSDKARSVVRDLDPTNDLTFLRIRSKKHEIMVAPDKEFILIVIQNPVDWYLKDDDNAEVHCKIQIYSLSNFID